MIGRPHNLFRRWRALPRLAWHYRLARSRRLPYGPLRLWIEPTNACNLRCGLCPTGVAPDQRRGLMDWELYRRIIDEAAGYAVDVNLHHRGESLLHPRLVEMAALAAGAGLRVRLHTNGTLLSGPAAEQLARCGLWTISFSFDGATAEQYERARPGGRFEQVVGNVKAFVRRCAAMPSRRRPRIVVESMLPPGLGADLLRRQLKTLFADAPPDRVVVKQSHNWAGSIPSQSAIRNPESEIPPAPTCVCTFPWYALAVFWDGRVTPCPQDYYGQLCLGSVADQSLGAIWNGPAMTALRDRLARRDVAGLAPCQTCDRIRRRTVAGVPADFAWRFLRDYAS